MIPDLPFDVEMTLQQLGLEPLDAAAASSSSSSGLSDGKKDLMDLASITVERCFRRQGVEVSKEEVKAIAKLQLQLAAVDVMEVFSPTRFTAGASRFGVITCWYCGRFVRRKARRTWCEMGSIEVSGRGAAQGERGS